MNRPGMKGYRIKTPKKKAKQDEDDVCFPPLETPLNASNFDHAGHGGFGA